MAAAYMLTDTEDDTCWGQDTGLLCHVPPLTTKGLQHDIIYRLAHCEAVSNGVTR